MSHLVEECFNWDIELGYDENGNCKGKQIDKIILSPPKRLKWNIPTEVRDLWLLKDVVALLGYASAP